MIQKVGTENRIPPVQIGVEAEQSKMGKHKGKEGHRAYLENISTVDSLEFNFQHRTDRGKYHQEYLPKTCICV